VTLGMNAAKNFTSACICLKKLSILDTLTVILPYVLSQIYDKTSPRATKAMQIFN